MARDINTPDRIFFVAKSGRLTRLTSIYSKWRPLRIIVTAKRSGKLDG